MSFSTCVWQKVIVCGKGKTAMRITAELDQQHFERLQQLEQQSGKDTSRLIEEAIDEMFAHRKDVPAHQALEIMRRNGFIGCMEGDDDLSVLYKEKLDWSHKL